MGAKGTVVIVLIVMMLNSDHYFVNCHDNLMFWAELCTLFRETYDVDVKCRSLDILLGIPDAE